MVIMIPFPGLMKVKLELRKLKGALLSLREFLVTGSPLKMMKNAFYFAFKTLCALQIF